MCLKPQRGHIDSADVSDKWTRDVTSHSHSVESGFVLWLGAISDARSAEDTSHLIWSERPARFLSALFKSRRLTSQARLPGGQVLCQRSSSSSVIWEHPSSVGHWLEGAEGGRVGGGLQTWEWTSGIYKGYRMTERYNLGSNNFG